MNLTVTINLDGAAFDDAKEIRRVLGQAADQIMGQVQYTGKYSSCSSPLIDINGNAVGLVQIKMGQDLK